MKKTTLLSALLLLPLAAFAGTEESKTVVQQAPPPSAISGDIGVYVTNVDIRRGIVIGDSGVYIQPAANLNVNLFKGSGFVNSVTASGGIWSSFSSKADFAKKNEENESIKYWTEFDWSLGVSVGFAERFSLSVTYLQWISPNDGYPLGRDLITSLGYNDAGLLDSNFSFQPRLTTWYSLKGDGSISGLKGPYTWYFNPSISPNYTFFKDSTTPVNVALPINFGLGDAYYNGDFLGYVSVGPQVTVTLGFIPAQYGKWNWSAGYRYYTVSNKVEAAGRGKDSSLNQFNSSLSLAF